MSELRLVSGSQHMTAVALGSNCTIFLPPASEVHMDLFTHTGMDISASAAATAPTDHIGNTGQLQRRIGALLMPKRAVFCSTVASAQQWLPTLISSAAFIREFGT